MINTPSSSDVGETQGNPNFPLEYTYHRHSEERNMIYFRCSDKNCKARVLFSKDTSKFTLKNRHLSPSVHKPNSRRAITGQQMSKLASIVKGPISLSELCNEPIFFSDSDTFTDSNLKFESEAKDLYLLRVTCENRDQGKKLCLEIVKEEEVDSAQLWDKDGGESCVVEVETCANNKENLISLLKNLTGQEKVECFRRI